MNNNEPKENKSRYEDSSGTRVLSAIIFSLIIMAVMYLVSVFIR